MQVGVGFVQLLDRRVLRVLPLFVLFDLLVFLFGSPPSAIVALWIGVFQLAKLQSLLDDLLREFQRLFVGFGRRLPCLPLSDDLIPIA